MTQYTAYASIPQAVRDLIANKCKVLDQYILLQTGERQYTALIRDPVTNITTQYTISRDGAYGSYSVDVTNGSWAYTVSNEYYAYSNIGYGAALDLPVVEGVQAHASAFLVAVLAFAILFKGVLFKCLQG